MARGRPLESVQTNKTIVLMVKDNDVWTRIRQRAIDRGRTISEVVEEALTQYMEGNVRRANG